MSAAYRSWDGPEFAIGGMVRRQNRGELFPDPPNGPSAFRQADVRSTQQTVPVWNRSGLAGGSIFWHGPIPTRIIGASVKHQCVAYIGRHKFFTNINPF